MASEETLARKKKVRTAHRASASRLLSQAESALGDSRIYVNALALLQTNLSAKLTMLEALDKELVELVPAEELEDEIGPGELMNAQKKYTRCLGRFAKPKVI